MIRVLKTSDSSVQKGRGLGDEDEGKCKKQRKRDQQTWEERKIGIEKTVKEQKQENKIQNETK
jgi:hypothetical protein